LLIAAALALEFADNDLGVRFREIAVSRHFIAAILPMPCRWLRPVHPRHADRRPMILEHAVGRRRTRASHALGWSR